MNSFITFLQKNTGAMVLVGLLTPIGLVLIYSFGKSFWVRRRNKRESSAIYNFLVNSNATEKAITNDEIMAATGVPRDRVIGHCTDHKQIEDAGKRQRSWKLVKADADKK
jgi:hypothetical protein